jgi:hypothetical protein
MEYEWKVKSRAGHPISESVCGIVNAETDDWVAKMHPINGTEIDLEEARRRATLMALAPELLRKLGWAYEAICLDTNDGAQGEYWPEWWDHDETAKKAITSEGNIERLRSEIEATLARVRT